MPVSPSPPAPAGALLDPFSYARLVVVTSGVSLIALVLTWLAMWGLERKLAMASQAAVRKSASEPLASGAELKPELLSTPCAMC